MGTVKKLSAKRAAKKPLLSRLDPDKVVIKPISNRTFRHILKRDAKIFAALAKCDTSDSKTS